MTCRIFKNVILFKYLWRAFCHALENPCRSGKFLCSWYIAVLYMLSGGIFNFDSYTPLRKLFSLNFIKPLMVLRLYMPYTHRATSQASWSKELLAFNQILSAIAALSSTGLVQDQQPGESWEPFFLQARSISPSRTWNRKNRRNHRAGKVKWSKRLCRTKAGTQQQVVLAQDTELTQGFRPQRDVGGCMCIPREDLSHAMT